MSTPAAPPAGEDGRLSRTVLGILFVELLSIAGLYWLGLHFAR